VTRGVEAKTKTVADTEPKPRALRSAEDHRDSTSSVGHLTASTPDMAVSQRTLNWLYSVLTKVCVYPMGE